MGSFNKPNITQVDTNPAVLKGTQGAAANFLTQLFGQASQGFGNTGGGGLGAFNNFIQGLGLKPGEGVDPTRPFDPSQGILNLQGGGGGAGPFAGLTSDLQRQALGGIGQFLGQNAPEQQVFQNLQDPLMQLVNQGVQGIGAFDQSQALVGAAQPIFQQNLQGALGQLSNAAPGRFSTAFAGQGSGLAQRALQDFNLFQQQALQSGLGLDLQARGLSQQGVLGAGSLLGSLAGQAGGAPFNRLLQAGQLGLEATNQAINPILQLMLGGLGFAQPSQNDTVVGKSGLDRLTDFAAIAASAFGGGRGG